MRTWKGKKANFKSLVAGRVACEAALHALEIDECSEACRVDGTNIINAYGLSIRVQAVCDAGRAVLVNPKNKIPVDVVVAIRVRFESDDLNDVELEYLGYLFWDEVATSERYVPRGRTVTLQPTDDHPETTIIRPSSPCYVVMLKDLYH